MKGIVKKATAVVLTVTVMCGAVMGISVTASAASLSAGALQYGADFSFLEGLFMSAGAGALGLDMLLKTKNDINNWDWGEVLDSPASQGQIDKANETIEKLYNNAVKDWHEKHGGSSGPTPTPLPDVSPPVTVAPINPDDLDIPEDWATLKKNATDKGLLAMGAATAYCVKEAVKGWWDELVQNDECISNDANTLKYADLIGKITTHCYAQKVDRNEQIFIYKNKDIDKVYMYYKTYPDGSCKYYEFNSGTSIVNSFDVFSLEHKVDYSYSNVEEKTLTYLNYAKSIVRDDSHMLSYKKEYTTSFECYIPYVLNGEEKEPDKKPLTKTALWPSVDLKDDYDNNRSPNFPELATPTLRLPSLDEIKDLWKQGSDDEENRPTYVTNFITNHTVQPTPEPEPTKMPEVNPNPGGGTDPDPGGGGDTDPDNPETPTPEEEASPYKADLREIFPFCIPFDLIHLLKVFDAEAEAPVFEFPLDIEMDNPWTGEKVVDYHHTFELDMADYEPVIKILRIFQVIFFIIALMLITRQQMIKG